MGKCYALLILLVVELTLTSGFSCCCRDYPNGCCDRHSAACLDAGCFFQSNLSNCNDVPFGTMKIGMRTTFQKSTSSGVSGLKLPPNGSVEFFVPNGSREKGIPLGDDAPWMLNVTASLGNLNVSEKRDDVILELAFSTDCYLLTASSRYAATSTNWTTYLDLHECEQELLHPVPIHEWPGVDRSPFFNVALLWNTSVLSIIYAGKTAVNVSVSSSIRLVRLGLPPRLLNKRLYRSVETISAFHVCKCKNSTKSTDCVKELFSTVNQPPCQPESLPTSLMPSSASTTMTPSSSSTQRSSAETSNTALFIGIGVGIGVACILLIVIIILILACWCSRSAMMSGAYRTTSSRQKKHATRTSPDYADPDDISPSLPIQGKDGYLSAVPSLTRMPCQLVKTSSGEYDYTYASLRRSRDGSLSSLGLSLVDRPRAATPSPGPEDELPDVFKEKAQCCSENESAYSSDIGNACGYLPARVSPVGPTYHELETELDDGTYASLSRSDSETFWMPGDSVGDLYAQFEGKRFRVIDREKIGFQEQIGAGAFGDVEKAFWFVTEDKRLTVAVKKMAEGASDEDRVKFLQEAAIMGQFVHRNVVALCGIVLSSIEPLIVLEFMPNGDLRTYLQHLRDSVSPKTLNELLVMARDVASGMEYLAKKQFVHRDLAARNILLDWRKTCKIGDFGLARDLSNEMYYLTRGSSIPIRWTAPEAVTKRRYSAASDVWSYGIVLYEMWSLAERPYGSWGNKTVIDWLTEGHRLAPPPACSYPVYSLMIQCWHPDHHSRPSFEDIVARLSEPDSCLLTNAREIEKPSGTLGGPLEESKPMYKELQATYL